MMKKLIWKLLIWNIILFTAVIGWMVKNKFFRSERHPFYSLKSVDKIFIKNLQSGYKFSLAKLMKSGKWEISWNDNTWMVNEHALTNFYERLKICYEKKENDLSNLGYEITIFSRKLSKNIKLGIENANFLFFKKPDNIKYTEVVNSKPVKMVNPSEDIVVAKFLNEMVFSRVETGCKIFKVKQKNNNEFVFSRRQGKWFLENFGENLEVSNSLITQFFHRIFSLSSTGVSEVYDYGHDNPASLTVTLYGDHASERVKFFNADNTSECFAINDAVDLTFILERKNVEEIINVVDQLLKFHIFRIKNCEDIDVVTADGDERFNFHDASNQNKWQFTYSQGGKFHIKEVTKAQIDELLEFLKSIKSEMILSDIPDDKKVFTLILNKSSDNSEIFSFYENKGKLFVEKDGKRSKFEINSSVCPMLFHILRSHVISFFSTADQSQKIVL